GTVDVLDDRRPDDPLGRVVRTTRLTSNPQHCTDRLTGGGSVAPDQDHCRRAMPWNVCTRSIHYSPQLTGVQELLDEFRTELTLHKRVRRDLPNPTRFTIRITFREVEKQFHEWHGQCVL